MREGSRNLSFVVQNGTSRPIHLSGGRIIAQVVATNVVPEPIVSPELESKLN